MFQLGVEYIETVTDGKGATQTLYVCAQRKVPGMSAGAALRLQDARHTTQAEFGTTQAVFYTGTMHSGYRP